MIDPQTVQKIKDTADIVEVVSDYVHLVKRGANYMGLCPFHNERTPSFSVNKARNFCHCFSCHKGGSPVNFIMEKEGVSYVDALLRLAKKYGIEVQERQLSDEEREIQSKRESLFVANDWAMRQMEYSLMELEEGQNIGLQYLYSRGVTPEAIKHFHLGYSLDRYSALCEAAIKASFEPEILTQLGLCGVGKNNHLYDRFRGRVMFPVINSSGKVVAFGGRDLKGNASKYINSPESDIYKKRNELYGMYQARSAITDFDRCFLVEGYLDVIGMWQAGIKNVVASSGTALTDNQIALIHRFTSNVTLIYDGDKAGINAALKGIDMFLKHGLNLKVLLLPEGEDPDSFARKCTPLEFQKYIEVNQTDMIRFKTKTLLNESSGDPQQRIEAIKSIISSIACISDKVTRDVYIQECSVLMNISAETVALDTEQMRRSFLQQWKKEQDFRKSDSSPLKPSNSHDSSKLSSDNTVILQDRKIQNSISVDHNVRLYKLEREVIRYCVKYGFLPLWAGDNDIDDSVSVLDYVSEELKSDNIFYTDRVFGELHNRLLYLQDRFRDSLYVYDQNLKKELDLKRKSGFNMIAQKSLSLPEIEHEEKNLERSLSDFRSYKLKEYSKVYPARILASDSDDNIRLIVTEFLSQKHQLSNIFIKNNQGQSEEDKLEILVPRAITEWKDGLLGLRMEELLAKLRCPDNSQEEIQTLMTEIAKLQQIRANIAKTIGDRTLSPSLRK